MRAETKGKHGMGKRSAVVIGVAAAGVMALGAQTALAATYNTKLTFSWEAPVQGTALFHGGSGGVQSKVRKCERGRLVTLFKQKPGADRKIATNESEFAPQYGFGDFGMTPPKGTLDKGDRVYVAVKRKVLNDGDVCRGDHSATKTWPTEPD